MLNLSDEQLKEFGFELDVWEENLYRTEFDLWYNKQNFQFHWSADYEHCDFNVETIEELKTLIKLLKNN